MVKKGKKKKQAAAAAAAASTSTSIDPSSETLPQQEQQQQEQKEQPLPGPSKPSASKQKHQKAGKDPQSQSKQQVALDPQKQQSQQQQPQSQSQQATLSLPQQQPGARGQPRQQQAALGQPPQQQAALGQSQQQQAALGQPQQQLGAWGQPRQQLGVWGQPRQQQAALGQPQQQQAALSQPPQQQAALGQPQRQRAALGQSQQQPGAWDQLRQQQAALGQLQQQQAALGQPQQQQAALGQSPQQPGAWGQTLQQPGAWGQPRQQQAALGQSQQQQAALGQPQQQPGAWGQTRQQQAALGQPQQQQAALGQPQQQPGAWGQPRQQQAALGQSQQQQAALGQPQQQPGAWGQTRQQQAALGQPQQQQAALGQPQQQPGAWGQTLQHSGVLGQPQQQRAALGQTQQQPGARDQSRQQQAALGQLQQQQAALGQPQQQRAALGQSQQQPGAWGQPPQQPGAWGQTPPQPGAWGQPLQQQAALGQLQQQQAALGQLQQQQAALSQPPQQQAALGQPPQQQAALGQLQQQPGTWGQLPQQPGVWGQPQQQQAALGQQQQQRTGQPQQQPGACSQIPQQVPPSQSQQQQKASIGIGAAGDSQQPRGSQQSSSTKSLNVLELGLTDPVYSEMTEKAKMSSSQMAIYQKMIPKRARPDQGGTAGLKIKVFTNMFKIIFDDKFVTNAIHYDVTIKPNRQMPDDKKESKLPKALCRNIFEQFRTKHFKNRYPAYDGKKNAYSGNDLPINDMSDVFKHENASGRICEYQIIIKKVATVDLSWIKNLQPGFAANRDQTAVQVLDIILRHAPEARFLNIGRSLFWDQTVGEKLVSGVVLGSGGFMSGILGWKPYLNVDVSHKGFTIKQRVLEYIAEVVNVREEQLTFEDVMGWRNEAKIQNFLRNLKVSYEIPNVSKRTHRIIKLSQKTCETTFTQEIDNRKQTVSIQQYFLNTKRYRIRMPKLPTLHVNTKSDGSEILLPIELCTIVANQPLRKLDEYATANMIKKTATDAFTRKQRIENAFKKIEVNNSPVMRNEFHLSVSQAMEQVPARILAAPELSYAREIARVNQGKWEMKQFKQAKHLEANTWTIVNLSGRPIHEDTLRTFTNYFIQTGPIVGMNIQNPVTPYKFYKCSQYKDIENFFKDNIKLKLIIVIVPNQTDEMYGKVKKITEMEVGVLTQCIKNRTLEKVASQSAFQAKSTLKNILLKINSKLNGVNHIFSRMPSCLANEQYPCMLVGADVTHPSPDSKDIPSIAAVAASRDKSAFRYNIALRLQQPKEEIIVDLRQIMLSHLQMYLTETKCAPKRIVYYRDGVSEGQLAQVMYYEIEAIKKAISEFSKNKKIDIEVTCLVVQKRHHVRLFPINNEGCIDSRTKNVQVGTIVDTTITHPDHIDFYLVSHASVQGTARPTKYRCIYNQSNFTEDQLEELTFYLCHIYARCARSVSYPAPTYYAHLAAYRGRALMQGYRDFKLCNIDREQRNFVNFTILKMGESPMFFV